MRAFASVGPLALLLGSAAAQTWSSCNPLTQSGCPPNPALGKTVNIDFSSASDSFAASGGPMSYGDGGAVFTVAQSGNAPTLTSIWYIMFGRVEVVMKAAPGVGIVSSVVLQSDTLDEIDWEWLGGDPNRVQTNYFGKGNTATYDRSAFHDNPNSQTEYQTYTIDWTSEQIAWQINGQTIRTLVPANANGQYPQTPMQLKLGSWAGGDPSNSEGTIEWAGGLTDYSAGPFSMFVKSVKVVDYSTGTQYVYSDASGTWQSIRAEGGSVRGAGSGAQPVDPSPPVVTTKSTGPPAPPPFQRTTNDPASTRTGYPWVPQTTRQSSSTFVTSSYPGLPSGWTVSDTGKVVPPSSASLLPPSTLSPSPSFSRPPVAGSSVSDTSFEPAASSVPPNPTSTGTISNDPQLFGQGPESRAGIREVQSAVWAFAIAVGMTIIMGRV